MRTLILDGSPKRGDPLLKRTGLALAEEIDRRGWPLTRLELAAMRINPCLGCFHCWVKTPGICVHRDQQPEVLKALAACELLVLLTPVTFGGYSSQLKKALDRAIPILLPFFIRRHGEAHHPLRYERPFKLLAVGTLAEPDADTEAIFARLVGRNGINMNSPAVRARFVYRKSTPRELTRSIAESMNQLEVA